MKTQKIIMSKNYFLTAIMLIIINAISAQNLVSHDFNNGNLGPFEVCTTKNPNYSRVVNKRLKTFWTEEGYRGNRSTRGAEACGDQFFTYKEGWYGMNLEIGSDYPRNKKAGIAQIFGFIPGFFSWEAQLQIDNGDLTIVHRPNGGTSQNTEEVVVANFPYQRKVPIVIHFILSNQKKGLFEIWVNGKVEYRKRNINFGFGDFDRNDVKIGDADAERGGDSGGSLTVFKMGQYNFESDDYDNNETRTVYYDDVSWYKGSNGYDIVNPGNNNESTLVHITKRNATGFAIDGNRDGARGQNVYLWGENENNVNQQWVEIDRGNGFYSYQKQGTNFCIDGGANGERGQNVYLWECSNNNRNQHWEKVNAGGGAFKLVKRNASGFALDGGSGGSAGQNIALYDSSSRSENLQWFITPIVRFSAKNISEVGSNAAVIYPNPIVSTATLENAANSNVVIFDISGNSVYSAFVSTDNEIIDLSVLAIGVYYARVEGQLGDVSVIKIVKE